MHEHCLISSRQIKIHEWKTKVYGEVWDWNAQTTFQLWWPNWITEWNRELFCISNKQIKINGHSRHVIHIKVTAVCGRAWERDRIQN